MVGSNSSSTEMGRLEKGQGSEETVMCCYECSQVGDRKEAIGICHHCSVGVCQHHSSVVTDFVTKNQVINRTVVLPVRARLLLCHVCQAALEQNRAES